MDRRFVYCADAKVGVEYGERTRSLLVPIQYNQRPIL